MAAQIDQTANFVFLLSDDYGEIGNTLYLLKGQSFAQSSTLLLPARLYATNKMGLPGKTKIYRSVQDILTHLKNLHPNIVFLFSAYLFTLTRRFTFEELTQIVQLCQDLGCQIIVSDPFQGLVPTLSESDFSEDFPPKEWFLESTGQTYQLLKTFTHYYPLPIAKTHDTADHACRSVYNPNIVLSASELETNSRRVRGNSTGKPRWLFVISAADYQVQCEKKYDEDVFINLVVRKLCQALEAGREAVFLGPETCIKGINQRLTSTHGITLLTFCPYMLFFALMLEAEYVFYWNVSTNSMVLRIANCLPMFFFDEGHIIWGIKSILQACTDNYYMGSPPTYLDISQDLTLDLLVEQAQVIQTIMKQKCKELVNLPTPQDFINDILATH